MEITITLLIIGAAFGLLLLFAPLGIWSQLSKTRQELEQLNQTLNLIYRFGMGEKDK